MAVLKIHTTPFDSEAISESRLLAAAELNPIDRFKKAFTLMALATMFKKEHIKKPQGLGIILKRKPL